MHNIAIFGAIAIVMSVFFVAPHVKNGPIIEPAKVETAHR